jgi:Dockerin type I domain
MLNQAAPTTTPVCGSPAISGPKLVAAVGGNHTFTANCALASGYVWSLNGLPLACSSSVCEINLPQNLTAQLSTANIQLIASNFVGSAAPAHLVVTLADVAASLACPIDFNGDGQINQIDALLFVRWLLGYRGAALVMDVPVYPANLAQLDFITQVSARLVIGTAHDFDNNGKVDAITDGLLLMRMTQGLLDLDVTNQALGYNAQRLDYSTLKTYFNATCGANF